MPAYTGLLEPRWSGLELLKSTFNAENQITSVTDRLTDGRLDNG